MRARSGRWLANGWLLTALAGCGDSSGLPCNLKTYSIEPKSVNVSPGGRASFQVIIDRNLTGILSVYQVDSPEGGTIDPNTGSYTAPQQCGTYRVTVWARSSNCRDSATVNVRCPDGG